LFKYEIDVFVTLCGMK